MPSRCPSRRLSFTIPPKLLSACPAHPARSIGALAQIR